MDKQQLKPCPFCGSESIDARGWASTDTAGPACDDCGGAAGCATLTVEQNIAAWNLRESQPPSASDEREAALLRLMPEVLASLKADGMNVSLVADLERAIAAPSPGIDAAGHKPYAYEYGRSNGDGTYSVVIDRGSLVKLGPNAYGYGPPTDAHKDRAVRPLYAAPPAAPPSAEWLAEATKMVFRLMQSANVEGAGHTPHVSVDDAKAALLDHLKARP